MLTNQPRSEPTIFLFAKNLDGMGLARTISRPGSFAWDVGIRLKKFGLRIELPVDDFGESTTIAEFEAKLSNLHLDD